MVTQFAGLLVGRIREYIGQLLIPSLEKSYALKVANLVTVTPVRKQPSYSQAAKIVR